MTSNFCPRARERTKRLDLLNNAAHTEKACDFAKHRQTIYVEADSGMAEQLRNVEEVSCAAAEIQNLLRSRQIEFKLANSASMLTPIQRSRSRYLGQSAPGSATAYRRRICSKPAGSIVSMTRFVPSENRFVRNTLSVCFLALARLLPSTSFRIL